MHRISSVLGIMAVIRADAGCYQWRHVVATLTLGFRLCRQVVYNVLTLRTHAYSCVCCQVRFTWAQLQPQSSGHRAKSHGSCTTLCYLAMLYGTMLSRAQRSSSAALLQTGNEYMPQTALTIHIKG